MKSFPQGKMNIVFHLTQYYTMVFLKERMVFGFRQLKESHFMNTNLKNFIIDIIIPTVKPFLISRLNLMILKVTLKRMQMEKCGLFWNINGWLPMILEVISWIRSFFESQREPGNVAGA